MSKLSRDLTQGPINQTLYRLTAPMVLGILAIFLFNLVDMYFISLLGTEPLAAVSFTFPITMTIMNLAIGLSIGAGAVLARVFGQKDMDAVRSWISATLLLVLLISFSMCLLVFVFQHQLYTWLGAEPELIPLIERYMDWWLLGGFMLVVLIVINATVRASGNTKLPSTMMLISAVLNGILDPILIFGLGPIPEFGIAGAAMATVISWVVAIVFITRKMIQDELLVLVIPSGLKTYWNKLLSLAIPAALTNMLVPLANGILIAMVAQHGTDAVAAFGVGMRLEPIAMIVIMALTAALPPFVGQNLGAGLHQRIEQGLWQSIRFVFVWQFMVFAVMALLATPLSRLFSDESEVQLLIQWFLYLLPWSYFGTGFSLVLNSTLNALHHPRISLMLSCLRLFVLYVPLAVLGEAMWGLKGLFLGAALGNAIMGVIVVVLIWQGQNSAQWRQKLLAN